MAAPLSNLVSDRRRVDELQVLGQHLELSGEVFQFRCGRIRVSSELHELHCDLTQAGGRRALVGQQSCRVISGQPEPDIYFSRPPVGHDVQFGHGGAEEFGGSTAVRSVKTGELDQCRTLESTRECLGSGHGQVCTVELTEHEQVCGVG